MNNVESIHIWYWEFVIDDTAGNTMYTLGIIILHHVTDYSCLVLVEG